jgi:TRAP-type C4-dicarboxylate transport system permease small subunit
MRRALDIAAKVFGFAAAACVAAMMLLTVADVSLRAVFARPIHGTFELVELLLAGAFFFALPAVFLRDEHIVVDVVDRQAPRAVPWLRRAAGSIAVALLAVMTWQGARAARDTWAFGDVTMDLSLPRILYWVPVLAGLACAALAALLVLARGRERR